MDFTEARQHAGDLLNAPYSVWERAAQAMPHYIWTVGDERHREGKCTACGQWMDLRRERLTPKYAAVDGDVPWMQEFVPQLYCGMERTRFEHEYAESSRHGSYGVCPRCGAAVQFRSLNVGRKTLVDRLFLVVYAKSKADPQIRVSEANRGTRTAPQGYRSSEARDFRRGPQDTVVCVGYDVYTPWREMEENCIEPPMELEARQLCVFRYGRSAERWIREPEWNKTGRVMKWHKRGVCRGALRWPNVKVMRDERSFLEAVEDTPFERVLKLFEGCDTGIWACYDRIDVMARLAGYPCIEYLMKLGMDELAQEVMDKRTGRLLNLHGQTAQKVLRLSDDQWAQVKGKKLKLNLRTLEVCAYAKRHKLRMSMELCARVGSMDRYGGYFEQMVHALGNGAVRAVKYCHKNEIRPGDYMDYLKQLQTLDMMDRQFWYPKDFNRMHTELSARVQHAKSHVCDQKIAKRIESGELDEYFFSAAGLVLRPMMSGGEIVAEGTRQSHCVGGYVETYASGNDVLCVLREETAMDRPLYTVEFSKEGKLVQCRGYRNDMTPEGRERRKDDAERLALFWRLFEMTRDKLHEQSKSKGRKAKAA